MLTEHEIASVANDVLSAALSSNGYERSYVRMGLGRDGDPLISVVARFRTGVGPLSGKSVIRAISALREALRGLGEERESVLRYEFPDEDAPAIEESEFGPLPS